MEKIPSFRIDHTTLLPGVYISREDVVGGQTVTTFDIRMTAPNREPALSVSALHALEHLAATWLRNSRVKEDVVYWGPMGCCTGNYLILKGKYTPERIRAELVPLLEEMFAFVRDYEGDIPGASERDCGNYLLMSLPEAKFAARRFLQLLPTCPVSY